MLVRWESLESTLPGGLFGSSLVLLYAVGTVGFSEKTFNIRLQVQCHRVLDACIWKEFTAAIIQKSQLPSP